MNTTPFTWLPDQAGRPSCSSGTFAMTCNGKMHSTSCKEKRYVSHSYVSQGSLLSGGYRPYPLSSRDHNGVFTRKPKIQFQSFFLINFNSTAPFRMHFWCPIWPGGHSVVILSDLFHVKWIDHMSPTAMVVRGLTRWWLQAVPPITQGP